MPEHDDNFEKALKERFAQLPEPLQKAITSAEVTKKLRELATSHQLHLDQWESLENEVMLALLGFQPVEDLEKNIKNEVNLEQNTAQTLAADINKAIFEPIRQELERQLGYPEAKNEETSDMEKLRQDVLSQSHATEPKPAPPVVPPPTPATPPPPPPTTTALRGPASGSYKSGEPSVARKVIVDDPYREQVE